MSVLERAYSLYIYIAFYFPLPQLEQQMQLELNTTWAPLELCEVSS